MNKIIYYILLLTGIVTIIPSMIVIFSSTFSDERSNQNMSIQNDFQLEVPVYRTMQQQVEKVDIEQYVAGVLSAEMPADFEMEALKAQAMAARTYIVKQLLSPQDMHLPEDAVVTDTIHHQVYRNQDDLKKLWGKDFAWKYDRIIQAVNETKGKVLTYNGEPITASFFSTSNGYTENSEEYWKNPLPYLKSVQSPWDKQSPKFKKKIHIPVQTFEEKLNVNLPLKSEIATVLKRTEGKRIAKIEIGGKTFTGREVREKLDLPSTDFSMTRKNNHVVVETKGYGHGVGLSQYGAHGMALEGKKAEEIVRYYYQGITIEDIESFQKELGKALKK